MQKEKKFYEGEILPTEKSGIEGQLPVQNHVLDDGDCVKTCVRYPT